MSLKHVEKTFCVDILTSLVVMMHKNGVNLTRYECNET